MTNPEEFHDLKALWETEKDRRLAVRLAPACGTASKLEKRSDGTSETKEFKVPGPPRQAYALG